MRIKKVSKTAMLKGIVENSLSSDSEVNAPSIKAVNEKIGWKLAGSTTKDTILNLPTNFNELLVEVHIYDDSFIYYILKDMLSSAVKNFDSGYYWKSTSFGLIQVAASNTTIKVAMAVFAGNDQINRTSMNVYYR